MSKTTDARSRILDAAWDVLRDVGVDAVRMEQVAGRAGLARPNLYRYFSNKAQLVRAVLFAEIRHIHDRRRAALCGVTDPHDRLIESLVLGAEQTREADAVLAVAGPRLAEVERLVAEDRELLDLEAEYWAPVLAEAREAGVVRADLSDHRAIQWFMTCQLLVATQPALVGDDLRAWVTQFVVPPLLATIPHR